MFRALHVGYKNKKKCFLQPRLDKKQRTTRVSRTTRGSWGIKQGNARRTMILTDSTVRLVVIEAGAAMTHDTILFRLVGFC